MFDAYVEAPGIIGTKRSYNDPIDFFNTLKVFVSEAQNKDTIKFTLTNFTETKKVSSGDKMTYDKGKELLLGVLKDSEPLTVKKIIIKIDMAERTAYWYLMKMMKEKLVISFVSFEGKKFALKEKR